MDVNKEKVVSIDYTVKDDDGNVLDTSEGRGALSYLHGSGNIIPGLEQALDGHSQGDEFAVKVEPDQAYGDRDDALIQAVPRDRFPADAEIQPGVQFQAQTPAGPRPVTVVKVAEEEVTIDANHPLAGQSLNFEVKVVEVREATPEELQHGHAHGAGGHQH